MSQTNEVPTDLISQNTTNHDSLAVMAYRMGAVERNVQGLVDRFDSVANNYVSTATLMLTLDPLKARIGELELDEKEREKKRTTEQAQFKLAITMAVIAPMLSIIVNLIVNK